MEKILFILFLIILIFVLAIMIKVIFSIKIFSNNNLTGKIPWDRTICVNLDKNKDRWRKIVEYSNKNGINIERFPAVLGSSIDITNTEQLSPTEIQLEWDTTINSMYDPNIRNPGKAVMTPGEIGCALSHIRIWKYFQNTNVKSVMIIEDDAEFVNLFKEISETLWELKPLNWDIIFFGFTNAGSKLQVYNKYFYKPEYGFETVGYVVSKQGLDKLVSLLPVSGPVDVWLSENFDKLDAWAIDPRLIYQKNMGQGDVNYSSHQ